jgi:hypothetical protein
MKISDLSLRQIDHITAKQYPITRTFDAPEPYVVYRALKNQFGEPNGSITTNTQWSYELATAGAMLRIQDWKLYGWTVEIYPDDKQKASADAFMRDIVSLFNTEAARSSALIKNIANNSKQFMLQNSYRIYFDSASTLLNLAEQSFDRQQRDILCRSAFFLFLSAFEGLLNLMYELYLKNSIRSNKDGRESVIRANLDQKILLAPVYCMCFSQEKMEFHDDTYDRYKAIRSLRNNFIHANMTQAMKTSVIMEDEKIFLLEPSRIKEFELPLIVSNLSVGHIKFVQKTVEDMKNAIVSAMSVHYRHDFARALEDDEIIVEYSEDQYLIRKHL